MPIEDNASVVPWLPKNSLPDAFPHPRHAIDGLLAIGGDLSPKRILAAYLKGIFPWYEKPDPILWWSPDPRAVLFPGDLHISQRLARNIRQSSLKITADTAFLQVIRECAAPRKNSERTWISDDMSEAYLNLHELGWAHSFEAWHDGDLVAGIYGIAIGRVFFGESMFSRINNASKILFVNTLKYLISKNFELIDCQVSSKHLQSLGATTLPRIEFLRKIEMLCKPRGTGFSWALDHARYIDSIIR
jgi:leucyl/phenylalanyl-tRNA--protein transferase